MFDLSIALFSRKCKHIGCDKPAGPFGFCSEHEAQAIESAFAWYATEGVTPTEPKCFESLFAWKEYVVAYFLSRNPKLQKDVHNVDYCKDCNPEYKKEMLRSGRCAHPETVFIAPDGGGVVGVPLLDMRRSDHWEKAIMGMSGPVVGMPPSVVIDKIVSSIATKKKGGRPKKQKGGDDALTVPAVN